MKKKKQPRLPSPRQASVLRQLVELIPAYLVAKLSRAYGVDKKSRTFTPWSHVVTMLYAQFTHVNDVCDALRLWATPLRAIRGATPPSRNALSNANKVRDCALAEALFWQTLAHLEAQFPRFGRGASRGLAWRFRRTIHVVDATVIQLLASCLDWAKHNRRKAAAKCHVRLGLRTLLPGFVVIGSARESELAHAARLCAGLKAGEIVLFDRGYHVLGLLADLTARGVYFVTRPREHTLFKVVKKLPRSADERVLADELVVPCGRWSGQDYPGRLRRVRMRIVLDGVEQEMTFMTNHEEWSATSIAELYRCRWQIEAFFKQIEQTLQLADFLGHSANAVRWQVWTALLVYVLLRFQSWRSRWAHSFARLFTLLRAALWLRRDLAPLLRRYGTAPGDFALLGTPAQSWLPGLAP